ncbi:hypothetical protein BJX63DRAFT_435926 [Aspergillus granulosus]|uniref:Uncharacterized protein n=1 Tax=Aspergillus granulosus TaxID=176169 RepID=A0ABR4GZL1_9EURO
MNQHSSDLTDFVGNMPAFKKKVKLAQEPYYVNGVKDQTTKKKRIDPNSDSVSDQGTVVGAEVQATEKTPVNPDSDSLSDQVTVVGSIHKTTTPWFLY